jgi:hypothetical protein
MVDLQTVRALGFAGPWDEGVDREGMGAFDPELFDLFVLDLKVLPLSDLVATPNILFFDRLAGFGIDKLLLQLIPGF